MRKKISILLILTLLFSIVSLPGSSVAYANDYVMPDSDFLDKIYEVYRNDDPNLAKRMNRIEEIEPHILNHSKTNNAKTVFNNIALLTDDTRVIQDYRTEEQFAASSGNPRREDNPDGLLNSSKEGRPIYRLEYGNPDSETRILVWSQMHGDESTGTRALLDIFDFLEGTKDHLLSKKDQAKAEELRQLLHYGSYIHFIPMLNPDGANLFQRRTTTIASPSHPWVTPETEIDLNRDAGNMEAPEAKLLWRAYGDLKPNWGFNLHDQNLQVGVTGYDTPASITLLSPGMNFPKHFNDARLRATGVVAGINELVQEERPNAVGRYSDDWGQQYFGDSLTMAGVGVILIESGGSKLDPEKVTLRRTNFKAILRGLAEMASGNYAENDISSWLPATSQAKSLQSNDIPHPPNRNNSIEDVQLYNVLAPDGKSYDLSIRRNWKILHEEVEGVKTHADWYYSGTIQRSIDLTASPSSQWKGDWPYYAGPPYGYVGQGNATDKGGNVPLFSFPYYFGYESLDCAAGAENLKLVAGKVGGRNSETNRYEIEGTGPGEVAAAPIYKSIDDISLKEAWELLKRGICAVRIKEMPGSPVYDLPLTVLAGSKAQFNAGISAQGQPLASDSSTNTEVPANFFLANRNDGSIRYAVINGYLLDLSKPAYKPTWGVRDFDPRDSDAAKAIDERYEGHYKNYVTVEVQSDKEAQ